MVMRHYQFQVVRVLAALAAVWLGSIESPLFYLALSIWLVLCVFGVLATVPVVMVIGIGAGAAQADGMSDEFAIGLVFVLPTILAIVIAELFLWWRAGARGRLDVSELKP